MQKAVFFTRISNFLFQRKTFDPRPFLLFPPGLFLLSIPIVVVVSRYRLCSLSPSRDGFGSPPLVCQQNGVSPFSSSLGFSSRTFEEKFYHSGFLLVSFFLLVSIRTTVTLHVDTLPFPVLPSLLTCRLKISFSRFSLVRPHLTLSRFPWLAISFFIRISPLF